MIEVLEQFLHALWPFSAVVLFWLVRGRPAWGWRAIVGGTVVGLAIALPRELVDQWPINRPLDTILDILFFAVGGTLGALPGVLTRRR